MDLEIKRILLKMATGSFLLKVLNFLLNFFISISLARLLGTKGYGEYAFVFSVMSLLAIPVHLGVPNLLIREVARYQVMKEWNLLKGIIKFANYFSIAASFLVAIISASALYLFFNFDSKNQVLSFYISFMLLPLIGLGRIREAILQGFGEIVLAQIPEKLVLPGIFFFLISLSSFFIGLHSYTAMILYCISAVIGILVGSWFLYKMISKGVFRCSARYELGKWMRSIFPLALMSGLHVISGQTDIFMLGVFLEKNQVALYRVAFSGAALVIFTLTIGNSVVSPYISRLYAAGKFDDLQYLISKSARINFFLSLPIVMVLFFFGSRILGMVYGDAYLDAYSAMIILAFSQLVNVSTGVVSAALIMTGHEKTALYGLMSSCAINILLNYILIPLYGINGAAFATGVSIVFINILLVFLLWNKTRLISFVLYKR